MMKALSMEVSRAILDTRASASQLSHNEARELFDRLEAKFTSGNSRWPLWEHFRFPARRQDPSGWRQIGSYVADSPCLLFFNPDDAKEVFRFASGADLALTLGGTFGFEFYVTDESISYCVCFNHHDMLLGFGAAETWVKSLR